ncbi:hypothetical protein B296_00049844 [Ensete ventricosum]|uniref:Uncharacterized protein n=1 Tax=Ensete ventricosum TaxID=4639 RepID=A0A426YP34_ENSVE|nr:hypothetical protein B296_00049844 [Ensete ventricosum]
MRTKRAPNLRDLLERERSQSRELQVEQGEGTGGSRNAGQRRNKWPIRAGITSGESDSREPTSRLSDAAETAAREKRIGLCREKVKAAGETKE